MSEDCCCSELFLHLLQPLCFKVFSYSDLLGPDQGQTRVLSHKLTALTISTRNTAKKVSRQKAGTYQTGNYSSSPRILFQMLSERCALVCQTLRELNTDFFSLLTYLNSKALKRYFKNLFSPYELIKMIDNIPVVSWKQLLSQ